MAAVSLGPEPQHLARDADITISSISAMPSELTSPVWSKLPLDIPCLVVEECDDQTLTNWSCADQFFYEFASNLLWEVIVIETGELIDKGRTDGTHWDWVDGVRIDPIRMRREHNKILYFVEKDAFRQSGFPMIYNQKPKLPGLRVRFLRLDLSDGGQCQELYKALSRRLVVAVISKLLPWMPNLQSCSFEGPLHSETLDLLVARNNLYSLAIRLHMDFIRRCVAEFDAAGDRIPGMSQILDLRCLSRLQQLQGLTIGRLVPMEANGLARALIDLTNLVQLSISAAPPANIDDERNSFAGFRREESPILTLLDTISRTRNGSGAHAWNHLPKTIKHLNLVDNWRCGCSTNNNLLTDTISPCSNMFSLGLRLMATDLMYNFFLHTRFPVLEHLIVAGCRHSLEDQDWLAMGLNVRNAVPGPSERPSALKEFTLRHRDKLQSLFIRRPALPLSCTENGPIWLMRKDLERVWNSDREEVKSVRAEKDVFYQQMCWDCPFWAAGCDDLRHAYCYAANNRPKLPTMWNLKDYLGWEGWDT
ncbi:MAG: hypothetical protein Q9181_006257 [Wetmoreana brouardii]